MMSIPSTRLKTLVLLIAGLSVPASVFASNTPCFNGFYVGANAGILQNNVTISNNANSLFATLGGGFIGQTDLMTLSQSHVNLFSHTGIAQLDIGYGHFFPNSQVYLAGEIFINTAHRKKTLNNGTVYGQDAEELPPTITTVLQTSNTIKLRNEEYGFDLRPGYLVGPSTMIWPLGDSL